MADEDPEDAPLGDWLEELRAASGLSLRALSQSIGVDRSNVRNWLNGKGMNARSLLLYLKAVGATISPTEPDLAPGPVNAELLEIRRRLEALEAAVARAPTAKDLQNGLAALQEAIGSLASRGTSAAPRAGGGRQ